MHSTGCVLSRSIEDRPLELIGDPVKERMRDRLPTPRVSNYPDPYPTSVQLRSILSIFNRPYP